MTGTLEVGNQDILDLCEAIECYRQYRNLLKSSGTRSTLIRLENIRERLMKVEVSNK